MSKTVKKKECSICKRPKILSEFSTIKNNGKYVLSYRCKTCDRLRVHDNKNTFDGYLKGLLRGAKASAKTRKNKGREKAGKFDLTFEQILELYKKQDGKCFYSKIKMSTKTCSKWKASIERLNDEKGYTINNIVLVCHEFNHKTKWSHEKLNEMIHEISKNHDHKKIVKEIEDALIKKSIISNSHVHTEKKYKTINGEQYLKCLQCEEYKLLTEYYSGNSHRRCKKCVYINKKQNYMKSIRGHFIRLLTDAKHHTKERSKVKSRQNKENNICDLSLEDLVDILKKQKGLCHISGIKMNYGSYLDTNWVASLERIDSNKGYTKDNVCFVCCEFNTTDNSSRYKHSNNGTGNWTQNKFLYFLERYRQVSSPKFKRSDC